MELKQTLPKAVYGYWDGGAKKVFRWRINSQPLIDTKGFYVRIGSWEANYWFHVAVGRSVKDTLANAKRRLRARVPESCFKYVDTEPTYFEHKLIEHLQKSK